MKRRFLTLWSVAVIASSAAFVVHLALRFETVRLGYEVGNARKVQRRLLEQRRTLSLEAATLRQTPRIEFLATQLLGMETAKPNRVVSMDATRIAANTGAAR
ncbi:MAG: cell division protein FtsL [Myxococcales bacterium]|nr:MAG: cell division protein FtsL [Myxococcales bacterium]